MKAYIEKLNLEQKNAVLHLEGPMMIIAGAGSGKTRVLTYRIAHLIQQEIDPFRILVLTFTKKAAQEMKERIAKVVGNQDAKNIWMGTFHAIFARILRYEADKLSFPKNFTIYDTQDSVNLISRIIKELHLDKELYKPKSVLGRISSCKNNLVTVNAYQNNAKLLEQDTITKRPAMLEIYKNYAKRCFKAGAMDFDDLLLKTNELFARFPEVLEKYQDRFGYIMVDEYQDTNHSQYLIIKALAAKFKNICVVGDDSQSIYGFRGANIGNILNFQKDYPNTKIFKLEQNYRSTKNVVGAANSMIAKNKNRLQKNIWTHNSEGGKVKIMKNISDREEAFWVANSILEHKQRKLKNQDFCILYRTNAQSRVLEESLRKKGIPYKIYGGLSFYQRKEIKDILAYLRLIVNPKDEESLLRIINYPARGIGKTTLDKLIIHANKKQKSIYELLENIENHNININYPTKIKLKNFANMLKSFAVQEKEKNAFELTKIVLERTQILNSLKESPEEEDQNRLANIEELLNGILFFVEEQEQKNEPTNLHLFLEEVALQTTLDEKQENKNSVSLMTIHSSKGLEYPYVYIVGMEQGLFPSGRSMHERSELEEERRLFYVALTRAEKQIYLSYAQNRFQYGKQKETEPSAFLEEIAPEYVQELKPNFKRNTNAFLDEIPKERLRYAKPLRKINLQKQEKNPPNLSLNHKIKTGDIISHERFGKGKILKIEGHFSDKKALIEFENLGIKNILLKFARLKIIQ